MRHILTEKWNLLENNYWQAIPFPCDLKNVGYQVRALLTLLDKQYFLFLFHLKIPYNKYDSNHKQTPFLIQQRLQFSGLYALV